MIYPICAKSERCLFLTVIITMLTIEDYKLSTENIVRTL